MNRGDRRERIFMDAADRQRFVDTLGEVCAKTDWQVHAYVLRPNPFHWVVETPPPNRVAGMKGLLGTDPSRCNRRQKLFGHLFSGRSKSLIVDGSGSGYPKSAGDYVHLNPARAKRVAADRPLQSCASRSWPADLIAPSKRPAWLQVDQLLGEWGIPKVCHESHARFAQDAKTQRTDRMQEIAFLMGRGKRRIGFLSQIGEAPLKPNYPTVSLEAQHANDLFPLPVKKQFPINSIN